MECLFHRLPEHSFCHGIYRNMTTFYAMCLSYSGEKVKETSCTSFIICTNKCTYAHKNILYRGADESLARPGRKQATATKFSLLQTTQKKKSEVCPSPRQQLPPRRTKNDDLSIVFSVESDQGLISTPVKMVQKHRNMQERL